MAAPLAQADQTEQQEMTEEEQQALFEEAVATVDARMNRASTLSFEEGVDAVVRHISGEELDEDLRFELSLFLAQAIEPETDAAGSNGFVEAVMSSLIEPTPASNNWGSDAFDAHSENMAVVYDTAAGLPVLDVEIGEQNVRATGSAVKTASSSGGGVTHFWSETTRDFVLASAKDVNHDVDSIVSQFATTHRTDAYRHSYIHWHCSWFSCFPHVHYYYTYASSTPVRTVATDVTFEHAFPANAGQLATRAESSDALMPVYDSIAHVSHQKAREETTAPVQDPQLPPEVPALPPTPPLPPEVPEGRPGLGDLGAQAPVPNYYGTQSNPDNLQDVPPAPPEAPDTPDVRNRATSDDARTGVTVGHTAERIQSWESNLVVVRWNNIGTGTEGDKTTLGEAPATFFYDAATHIAGGGSVSAFDFSIVADLANA